MSDPLGTTASIIALLQLTKTIVNYVREVKDGSEDRVRLRDSILSTVSIMEMLKFRFEDARTEGVEASLESKMNVKAPLKELKRILEDLAAKLTSASKRERVIQTIKWPFEKKEVNVLLSSIETQKSFFGLAIQNEHMRLSEAIRDDVKKVTSGIADLQTGQAQQIRTDQEHKALEWISPIRFWEKQADVEAVRVLKTSEWILQDPLFIEWLNGTRRTLWCPGIPGAGKTVIASMIIRHLLNIEQSRPELKLGVAFIYCNYKEKDIQTLPNLMSSILHQLAIKACEIPKTVMDEFIELQCQNIRSPLNDLIKALHAVIPAYQKVYVIIDALDECSESDGRRSELIKKLKDMPSNFKILCTSRELLDIQQLFFNSGKISIYARDTDIETYLRGQIEKSQRLKRHVQADPSLLQAIVTKILEKVDGMFLLAQLHVEMLSKKQTRKAVRQALETLPVTLDDTYSESLRRIRNQDNDDVKLAENVLQWISFALKPLTVDDLRYAVAVGDLDPTENYLDDDAFVDQEVLVDVCAGMVTIDSEANTIRLVHFTTQEYFERNRTTIFPDGQKHITRVCLRYLSFKKFSKPVRSHRAVNHRKRDHPLFTYAAIYWGIHAIHSPEKEVWKEIHEFFKLNSHPLSSIQALLPVPGDYKLCYIEALDASLWITSQFNLTEAARFLLSEGANINVQIMRKSALRNAVSQGHEEIAKLLLDHSAAADEIAQETVLSLAAMKGHLPIVKMLLERGFDVHAHDYFYGKALLAGGMGGSVNACQYLLDAGASVTEQDWLGQTILHYPALNENAIKLFVSNGADVNAVTRSGETPLHNAASRGNRLLITLLLNYGAEVNARTLQGHTPMDKAIMHGYSDVAEWLASSHGAVTGLENQSASAFTTSLGSERHFPLQIEHRLDLENDAFNSIFSHSGQHLAICGSKGYAWIYETENFTLLQTLKDTGSEKILNASWSFDDSKITTGDKKGDVRIWDVMTGQLQGKLPYFKGLRRAALWVPDQPRFITYYSHIQSSLCLWSEDGTLLHDVSSFHRLVACAISPESRNIIAFGYGNIYIYHLDNLLLLACKRIEDQNHVIYDIMTSPSSPRVVIKLGLDRLAIMCLETLEVLRILKLNGEEMSMIWPGCSFGGMQNNCIAMGNMYGHINIWNLETGELVKKQNAKDFYRTDSSWNKGYEDSCTSTWNPKIPSMLASTNVLGVRIWNVSEGTSIGDSLIEDIV